MSGITYYLVALFMAGVLVWQFISGMRKSRGRTIQERTGLRWLLRVPSSWLFCLRERHGTSGSQNQVFGLCRRKRHLCWACAAQQGAAVRPPSRHFAAARFPRSLCSLGRAWAPALGCTHRCFGERELPVASIWLGMADRRLSTRAFDVLPADAARRPRGDAGDQDRGGGL